MFITTRRDFLKHSALTGGALALGAGRLFAEDAVVKPVDMVIARRTLVMDPNDDMAAIATKLTEQAIANMGGMSRFVSKGDVVWVKPNIGWNKTPELAANTNPDVVGTLVRLCFEAGAKAVKVGDNTCNKPEETYQNSGIADAARKNGAEVVIIDNNRFKMVQLGGEVLKEWELYPEIIETDLVINCPIVKHHGLSTATVCMKNYMGVIGGQRGQWHQNMAPCLADITRYMKPPLCVVDGVRILTNHGPQGGDLADVKRMDTVAAGVDIVGLDALGVELLGHKPEDIPSVANAQKAGLGKIDYRSLNLKEVTIS